MSRMFEAEQEKRSSAVQFAISQGVLAVCPYHEEIVLTADRERLQDAYKAAAYQFARGEHKEFQDQRELTDYIKAAVEDHPLDLDECPRCDKWDKD